MVQHLNPYKHASIQDIHVKTMSYRSEYTCLNIIICRNIYDDTCNIIHNTDRSLIVYFKCLAFDIE